MIVGVFGVCVGVLVGVFGVGVGVNVDVIIVDVGVFVGGVGVVVFICTNVGVGVSVADLKIINISSSVTIWIKVNDVAVMPNNIATINAAIAMKTLVFVHILKLP